MLQSHRHFLRAVCGRNPQVCRQNCNSMCHTVGDISTSGLDGHIAISGCPSMSYLFVGTFFDFGVVENFVFRARIRPTVIGPTYFRFIRLYESVYSVTTTMCCKWWPITMTITTSGFLHHVANVQIPLFILMPSYTLPFSISNIQKYHIVVLAVFT